MKKSELDKALEKLEREMAETEVAPSVRIPADIVTGCDRDKHVRDAKTGVRATYVSDLMKPDSDGYYSIPEYMVEGYQLWALANW